MSCVITVLLDAFSSRYLRQENLRFFPEIVNEGYYTSLEPMFAFQGIGASIFSSTLPNTNKVWSDYVLTRKTRSLPKLFKALMAFSDLLPRDEMCKISRYIGHRLFNVEYGISNLIPPHLIDYFEPKLRKKYTADNPLGNIVTLFDHLRENSARYIEFGLHGISSDERIVERLLDALDEDYDFYFAKLTSLDRLGHRCGPKSNEVRRRISQIDHVLRRIVTESSRLGKPRYFLVFSDHGMSPVDSTFDISAILSRLPIKIVEDYFVFLNSTCACFWFNNQTARDTIIHELSGIHEGTILDSSKLEELAIDNIGCEYGELIFALKEGCVFFPDFYRRHRPPKGMHGYAYPRHDSPFMILYSPDSPLDIGKRNIVRHTDIMPTVLDLLDIPVPPKCEGKSLVETS